MWRVLHFGRAGKLLVLFGEDVVHAVRAHKRSAASGHAHLVVAGVVVTQLQVLRLGHLDGHERRHLWRVETVKGSIDVPPIEARGVAVLALADGLLVERLVVRVLESDVLEPLELGHGAVANHLDLGLVRDRLEIGVQH